MAIARSTQAIARTRALVLVNPSEGETHRIELNGSLDYSGPGFAVTLDPDTFNVARAELTRVDSLSLEPCADMLVLLRGLQQSLPFFPVLNPPETIGTPS